MSHKTLSFVIIGCMTSLLVSPVESYEEGSVLAMLNQTVDLSMKTWDDKFLNDLLTHIEINLRFHETQKWTLDIKAGFQLFLTKLNFMKALEHPRMAIFRENDYTPIKEKRLKAIATRMDDLNYFFRWRLLARVPRLNQTRLIAALFAFTEQPWFRFLPPMDNGTAAAELLARIVKGKFKKETFPTTPKPEEYGQDVLLEDASAKHSLYITQVCMQDLTRVPLNQTLMNTTALNETIPPERCEFPRSTVKACTEFVNRGFYNKTSGYELFFRLSLLTAARIARNCYIFSPRIDDVLVNYLCLMARLEADRLNPDTFKAPSDYYEKDSLTRHDYAVLCLLNGYKPFLEKNLTHCGSSQVAWNNIGCYGKKGAVYKNLTKPTPLWTVMRATKQEEILCYRRLTASCLAHHSFLIRGLVELGEMVPKKKGKGPDGQIVTTTLNILDFN